MNLVLLFPEDFVTEDRVRLVGRRKKHVEEVHRASAGDELRVGLLGGPSGTGVVERLGGETLEMRVDLSEPPPPKLPLTLVLALPRPKVLNRVLAGATSLGVQRIILMNAWRVEKAYWKSPRLAPENLLEQRVLGLEQARDTVLPEIETARFFRPFVEDRLPALAEGTLPLVAHPSGLLPCPHAVPRPVTLVVGPEGGFIPDEIALLERSGFRTVSFGPRILRVETAIPALVGRLFSF